MVTASVLVGQHSTQAHSSLNAAMFKACCHHDSEQQSLNMCPSAVITDHINMAGNAIASVLTTDLKLLHVSRS